MFEMTLPPAIGLAALLIAPLTLAHGAVVSPLFARGYTLIPTPQRVKLAGRDFTFSADWRLQLGSSVKPGDPAVQELQRLLRERFDLALSSSANNTLELAIAPNTVTPAATRDRDRAAITDQAYRLDLAPGHILITGNSTTGLYYGIQSFVQLLKPDRGTLHLPEAQIEDWPDLQLRIMYWDDAHHLERLDVLKEAVRQASFYKINGFAIKLEGHFEYAHAQPVVEPQALSPAQFQQLTDFGLAHHVQVIPYLDGPAHDAFILKHAQYAKLRAFPDSNYEFCVTNPDTYRLFQGMFDDLLAANKGGKYFLLSTDEPYYVGLAHNAQCNEAERAKELGSVGKLLAEFVTRTAGYLHDRGREVIFWGEYPLKPDDILALPKYVINGEVYGPEFDPVFRSHGIRQMIYTYTQGEEPMFPEYYRLPQPERLHAAADTGPTRIEGMLSGISLGSLEGLSSVQPEAARPNEADLMGVFIAGWADAGLHPETFWRGYVTGPAAGWHSGTSGQELAASFDALFYGPRASSIGRIYQLMSEGAQFWQDSWDTGPSAARKPIWGDSNHIFDTPHAANDQFLPPLPVPAPRVLRIDSDWRAENARRLALADQSLARNDELFDLLLANIHNADFNRYNLEVFLSIAKLYRQNLQMLESLGQIVDALAEADTSAAKGRPEEAVAALDRALDLAASIRENRNRTLQNTTETWYKSWLPRVPSANGRTFLHELDDVKDHPPDRTVDMSYLVYRELLYPMDDWANRVLAVRNEYARAHHIAERRFELHWQDTSR
jgi:hypothetical protein